jgi:hypothetical protein
MTVNFRRLFLEFESKISKITWIILLFSCGMILNDDKLSVKNSGLDEGENGENQSETLENKLTIIGIALFIFGVIGINFFNYAMWNYGNVGKYLIINLSLDMYLWIFDILWALSIFISLFGIFILIYKIINTFLLN